MNKLRDMLAKIFSKPLPLSSKNSSAINSNPRNALRADLIRALLEDLTINGITAHLTSEGIALEISHDELGAVYALIKLSIKGIDYDVIGAIEDYKVKQIKGKCQERK